MATSLLASSKLVSLAWQPSPHYNIDLLHLTPHLVAEGSVLDGADPVVGQVQVVQSLVELEPVSDGGHPGVVDDEAGDVGVEGDGQDGEGGVGAGDAQLVVVAVTAWKEERESEVENN